MRNNDDFILDTLFPRRQRKLMMINCHSLIKHTMIYINSKLITLY